MLKRIARSSLLLVIAIASCTEQRSTEQELRDVETQTQIPIEEVSAPSLTSSGFINEQDPIEVDGGSIQTTYLGRSINLNDASSLNRRWIVVPQDDLPLMFDGVPGVTTEYIGEFVYNAEVGMSASQTVTAFEVRFILYDIFNEYMTTLGATEVADMDPGGSHTFDWTWITRENEAKEYFMSIAFISHVRMANGQVYEFNDDAIIDVIRRVIPEASEDDIHIPSERVGGDPVI